MPVLHKRVPNFSLLGASMQGSDAVILDACDLCDNSRQRRKSSAECSASDIQNDARVLVLLVGDNSSCV